MKLIVTIPAYNEEKTLPLLIKRIHKVMKENKYNYEVMVLDDGSKDKTALVSKNAGTIVYSHPRNYGLADTFRTEMLKAIENHADIIIHIDADSQYMPEEIPKLVNELKKGNDLVLGSRFLGKIEEMPLVKRLGNIAFSRVITQITGSKVTDGQTGFRAFTKEVAKKIEITSNHTYTQEQIIKAVRHKFRIKEVPIYFARRKDESRLISNPFGYAIRAWINLIRIYRDFEPLKFFGFIGFLVLLLGFGLGGFLVYIQFVQGGVFRHLGLMMIDVLVLSVGLQILIFGFLADMFRK